MLNSWLLFLIIILIQATIIMQDLLAKLKLTKKGQLFLNDSEESMLLKA
jgi:hypothetical protein